LLVDKLFGTSYLENSNYMLKALFRNGASVRTLSGKPLSGTTLCINVTQNGHQYKGLISPENQSVKERRNGTDS
jgi:hypothetical protein